MPSFARLGLAPLSRVSQESKDAPADAATTKEAFGDLIVAPLNRQAPRASLTRDGQNPLLRLPAVGDNAAMEAEPPKADWPKRKRRWCQFSLRTLLIFMLVCAISCGWVARRIEQKRREREIVNEIIKRGGRVEYDFEIDVRSKPAGPDWLRRLLGENFFNDVYGLQIKTIGAPRLEQVKEMFKLKWVGLENTDVTDADLVALKGLPRLESLDLSFTTVGDDGLANLEKLTELRWLYLAGTNVTDDGLVHLKTLHRLHELDLTGTRVTDAGMNSLQEALPGVQIKH